MYVGENTSHPANVRAARVRCSGAQKTQKRCFASFSNFLRFAARTHRLQFAHFAPREEVSPPYTPPEKMILLFFSLARETRWDLFRQTDVHHSKHCDARFLDLFSFPCVFPKTRRWSGQAYTPSRRRSPFHRRWKQGLADYSKPNFNVW